MFNKIQKSILKNNYDDNSKGKEGGKKKSLSAIRIYLVVLLKSTSSIKNYFEEK